MTATIQVTRDLIDGWADDPRGAVARQPPKAHARTIAYDRGVEQRLFELRSEDGGGRFHPVRQEDAAVLADTIRTLIANRLTRATPERGETISLAMAEVRIVPLPSIGHRHVDPAIRRVLVEVPAGGVLPIKDIEWALAGGEVSADRLLIPAEDEEMLRQHYGARAPARRWRSITPVVLPVERPKARQSGGARAEEEAHAAGMLARMLERAGYEARGMTVRLQMEPFHAKGARADAFEAPRFERRRLRHAELTFAEPIVGPLILGDGGVVGLGLFAPSLVSTSVQVARYRFVRAPRVERTLEIADLARRALMSRAGDQVPAELSGRDEAGPLRVDAAHVHAFYLPEDADGDGELDHLLIYCRVGFSSAAQRALERLDTLRNGHDIWHLELQTLDEAGAAADSPLLGRAREWVSVTPFLKPRYDRTRPADTMAALATYRDQILREWRLRFAGRPAPQHIEPLGDRDTHGFVRTRRGRGGPQPDLAGRFFHITFPEAVEGPIALGKHAHFGMGLFRRV